MNKQASDFAVLDESTITISSDILGGTPVFNGTRVPIKTLFDYLSAGDSLERFLEHFPSVKREQAVTLLEQIGERFRAEDDPYK